MNAAVQKRAEAAEANELGRLPHGDEHALFARPAAARITCPVYMDHNATTPVDPSGFKAMRPYFLQIFGNAASRGHSFGWAAEAAVDQAREQVAALLNAHPDEVIWKSGSTESNNLAIRFDRASARWRSRKKAAEPRLNSSERTT